MACFETKIDYEFVYAVESISKSLEKLTEQVKVELVQVLPDAKAEDIYEALTGNQRDYVYRTQWCEHVKLDVLSLIHDRYSYLCESSNDEKLLDTICSAVAEKYVYEGDYESNLSYWDNLSNLVSEVQEGVKGGI